VTSQNFGKKIPLVPQAPGVYLFKDSTGEVIYVGKAANLRNRVRSYFGSRAGLSVKTLRMVSMIDDIEFIITGSEQEALLLEADLVKRYRPLYNARLKDDKSFPFLKVDVQNQWPTVTVTRRPVADGSRYFGPFASAWSVRRTLQLLRKVFTFRACSGPLPDRGTRPCLNKDIGLCPGPCVGGISNADYRETIEKVLLFLEGRYQEVRDSLVAQMNAAAAALDFEKAARLRDQVRAVELVTNRNIGVVALRGDQDIVAVAQDARGGLVEVFTGEVLRSFIVQYYRSASSIPPVVLLQYPVPDARLISHWLSKASGHRVRLIVPRTGVRKQLVANVADSVSRQFAAARVVVGRGAEHGRLGLSQLKDVLNLPVLPRRIEAYDISNMQGASAVGSMVVFEDGVPKPSEYRRFKIRTVSGQDDYAMMREVLRRRFVRLGRGAECRSFACSCRWWSRPAECRYKRPRGIDAAQSTHCQPRKKGGTGFRRGETVACAAA